MDDIYVTLYCHRPHRLSDGEPIDHRCRLLPVEALEAERNGDVDGMVTALEQRPFRFSDGVPGPKKDTE